MRALGMQSGPPPPYQPAFELEEGPLRCRPFRHLLEQHGLTEAIFEAVRDALFEHGLLLRAGAIVDATIVTTA